MSSSVHADNKKQYIFILGKGPTQRLGNTTPTAEAGYSINFTKQGKKFCLHYDGNKNFLFATGVKICQFKGKGSELIDCPVCLGNNSNNFSVDNVKTGLNEYMSKFSVNYRSIDVDEKNKKKSKIMFTFINKCLLDY